MPVHVIIGLQDPDTEEWKPIYIDVNKLIKGAHGEYMPRESICLWYEEKDRTSTVIDNQGTPSTTFDMTGIYQHYFMYDAGNAKWLDQNVPFPPGGPKVE
ncbi:hypothetical protein MFIFM68171_02098 [Madurella fahalii]|uniref:Uncharacterized protein n=1 Tax=Madurella fahalii TaxID=1157608 RepID=A0ABQ0G297_9PEZI